MSDKKKVEFSIVPKILNGGLAGIAGVSCVFPLDLVKARLQNQKAGPNGELMYSSIFDCFKKTLKSEGLFGMYRGIAINIILITPEKALKLSSNDFFRYQLTPPSGQLSIPRQMLAGAMAGVCQNLITTPMELLKIRMQTSGIAYAKAIAEGKEMAKPSALELAKELLRAKGFFGLYTGVRAVMSRDVTFSIVFFPLFATLNKAGPKRGDGSGSPVVWWSFLSGLGAASISALNATPLDVIKTRLQVKGEHGHAYTGFFDAASQIMKHEGPRAFYKGGACRMIVISPLFGIAQMVYSIGVAEYLLGYDRYVE